MENGNKTSNSRHEQPSEHMSGLDTQIGTKDNTIEDYS
jgi:hypothetical protein